MKNFLLISFLLFFCRLTAQIEGVITNQNTKQPIPYANIWIENENIGTTSSTEGHFRIKENVKNKQLFVSAIGYESVVYPIGKSILEIQLIPKVYELTEIKVTPTKRQRVVIGN
ncbi:MAG: carboxypeptidase-like regulatory domain-containing protein, partial [Bacteroidales bacterium]|nr:carboxypeptidase-like regulatory domain-containing protein [Bacteroidales bacterium]